MELRRRGRRTEDVVGVLAADRNWGVDALERCCGGGGGVVEVVIAGDLRRTGIELGDVLCDAERDMYLG